MSEPAMTMLGRQGYVGAAHMGYDKAALLHLLAHVRGHDGRWHGSGLRALDLVCKGVAKAHALPQAHVPVRVIGRPGKWPGRLLPQLLLLLLPLPDLQASPAEVAC